MITVMKLAVLGWQPKTSFDDGIQVTADWYRRFREVQWGNISRILTPFPVVEDNKIWTRGEHDALPSDNELGVEENNIIWTKKTSNSL